MNNTQINEIIISLPATRQELPPKISVKYMHNIGTLWNIKIHFAVQP